MEGEVAGVGTGVGGGVGGAVGGFVGVGGAGVGFGVGAWQSALVMGEPSFFMHFSVAPAGHGHEKELVGEVVSRR
jgi:hypothetical protein